MLNAIADRLSGGKLSEQAAALESLHEESSADRQQLALVQENLRRLEQALYDPEWRMMTRQADMEFTRQGLRDITTLARIMRLKNPLIKRGVEIQRLYVWAQGVSVTAADEEINAALQAFRDDRQNRRALTGHQARGAREEDLQQDGNLFFRFFVDRATGRVRLAHLDTQEIEEIVCNPENKEEPWLYKRTWTQRGLSGETRTVTEYYPDIAYNPVSRVARGLSGRVMWETPVLHVAVNRLGAWGVPEFYSAHDWALAYKNFLEQLATVWQSLARWAWKLQTKGGARGVSAARAKLHTTRIEGQGESNPPPLTGSTFIGSDGIDMQPFRTAGATMSAEDGRRLQLMAVMVFGFPETFFADASVGTLATAQSLDRPTELKISDRQALWTDTLKEIYEFVLLWAVKAPQGRLRGLGRVERERDGDQVRERVVWNENVQPTISVEFPEIIRGDTLNDVKAIVEATMGGKGIPMEAAVRRLLLELGFDDIDEVMELWREEQEARAADLTAQMGGSGGDADGDDDGVEEAWQARMGAIDDLIDVLRETAVNGNK